MNQLDTFIWLVHWFLVLWAGGNEMMTFDEALTTASDTHIDYTDESKTTQCLYVFGTGIELTADEMRPAKDICDAMKAFELGILDLRAALRTLC